MAPSVPVMLKRRRGPPKGSAWLQRIVAVALGEASTASGARVADGGFLGHGADGGISEQLLLGERNKAIERACAPGGGIPFDDTCDLPERWKGPDRGHFATGVGVLVANLADAKGR